MAKEICSICGRSTGVIGRIRLAGGICICEDHTLQDQAISQFDYGALSLEDFYRHQRQLVLGTRLWERIFVPLADTILVDEKLQYFGANDTMVVSPSTGLVAFTRHWGKSIFSKTSVVASVHRLADLYSYSLGRREVRNHEGTFIIHSFTLIFHTADGIFRYSQDMKSYDECRRLAPALNYCLGLGDDGPKLPAPAPSMIQKLFGTRKLPAPPIWGDRQTLAARADKTLSAII
ncbi:MAG: hypothetical protein IJW45_01125 [Oscillospiraceae bacterium]|nr:hypothetical protein [Oscillospiraceae bacterium]